MNLGRLCAALGPVDLQGDPGLDITAIVLDSRRAAPGSLFVAVKGTHADGHRFLAGARAAGCRAAVVQGDAAAGLDPGLLEQFSAVVRVPDTRGVAALLARAMFHDPDTHLFTAGVTGTNGKTTVAFLLRNVLERLHGPCGLLGTIVYQAGDAIEPAPLTTPMGPDLYGWLGRMVAAGCRSVSLELSSHALDQQRAAGLMLDVAVMTNLSRDHLDYHRDLQDYLAAKASILAMLRPGVGTGVINADDAALAPLAAGRRDCVLFSATGRSVAQRRPDLTVTRSNLRLTGTVLELDWRGETLHLRSPLVGRYNVENLAAALAAVLAAGYPAEAAIAGLDGLEQVPGRMERFVLPMGGLAVVDYAHTPDALRAILVAGRELTGGRILVVFGCGGDRDKGKRSLMGQVAAELADEIWITNDNPRSEDPQTITAEIAAGVARAGALGVRRCRTIPDRKGAIEEALAAAEAEDIVIIAGKGHEDYQLIGAQVLALDDRRIVREWIAKMGGPHA